MKLTNKLTGQNIIKISLLCLQYLLATFVN